MMEKIFIYLSESSDVLLLYLLAVIIALFGLYIVLASMNVSAKRRNAAYLKEILELSGWADLLKVIRNEEYVQAVITGCEIVLEE